MAARIHNNGGRMNAVANGRHVSKSATPTAYVVTPVAQADYSPAHVYASKIEVIGGPILSPNADPSWHSPVIAHIRRSLSNYIPGYDFIIPTGAPARMVLVGMVLKEKGERHKLLGWEGKTGRYVCYEIVLYN